MNSLETEFMLYQRLQFSDLSINAKSDTTVRILDVDNDDTMSSYRLDVLWYYLLSDYNIAGTQRNQFTNLAKIEKLILAQPYSNADEERVFSLIDKKKNKVLTKSQH